MITRTCKQCGQSYETYPSLKLSYCSRRCANKAKERGDEVKCIQCSQSFWRYASKPERRYCSKSCARTALNLTEANPSFRKDISGAKNPMAGNGMKGSDNPMHGRRKELAPRWNGGRKVRKDGYVLVIAPDDHPRPSDSSHKASGLRYILEHRLVMEQSIGRHLAPSEVIHHIDGNPSNNSIDNLTLLPDQATHAALHMEERWVAQDCATHDPEYIRYLWSAAWQRKREEAMRRAGYKCERCGKSYKKLAVHHKSYVNVRNERPEDLEVLCFACHAHITHYQP